MKELLTFDNSFSRHYDTLAKTRSRMTTSIAFSRKNDAGSLVSTTLYWENLVVVLVSESKALRLRPRPHDSRYFWNRFFFHANRSSAIWNQWFPTETETPEWFKIPSPESGLKGVGGCKLMSRYRVDWALSSEKQMNWFPLGSRARLFKRWIALSTE